MNAGDVATEDFQPIGPIIHGEGGLPVKLKRRTPDSQQRYWNEKITEMVMTQQELRYVINEREALKAALERLEAGDLPNGKLADPAAQQFAAEVLVKLERSEFRKTAG